MADYIEAVREQFRVTLLNNTRVTIDEFAAKIQLDYNPLEHFSRHAIPHPEDVDIAPRRGWNRINLKTALFGPIFRPESYHKMRFEGLNMLTELATIDTKYNLAYDGSMHLTKKDGYKYFEKAHVRDFARDFRALVDPTKEGVAVPPLDMLENVASLVAQYHNYEKFMINIPLTVVHYMNLAQQMMSWPWLPLLIDIYRLDEAEREAYYERHSALFVILLYHVLCVHTSDVRANYAGGNIEFTIDDFKKMRTTARTQTPTFNNVQYYYVAKFLQILSARILPALEPQIAARDHQPHHTIVAAIQSRDLNKYKCDLIDYAKCELAKKVNTMSIREQQTYAMHIQDLIQAFSELYNEDKSVLPIYNQLLQRHKVLQSH
ncbi:hypothetical protein [Biston robustus cypovirus]|nr:hypothetical protein [Biston robustus cypovirus]